YPILSHTWGEGEVTFQDIQDIEVAKKKDGYAKIEGACRYARKYHFEWIWIDSCCINKESSAELSEAINSMYQYYEDSRICYVYLADIDASRGEDPRSPKSALEGSKWFKRGWTLQELLAPSYVVLLDKDWKEIGTRWNLRDVISMITSIPVQVFEGGDIYKFSIAQRMSWAAFRETTRPEDKAYCLMGIFGVNMPPIYGEGDRKAFMRLQQEIIKISDDRSIFAWVAPAEEDGPRGLFARSASEFRMSGDVVKTVSDNSQSRSNMNSDRSYSFANNGLHIQLPLEPNPTHNSPDVYLAFLDCQSQLDKQYLSVYL
ncbi:HET-domain-containing protein, partial [Dendrothele bispora CBS 962.96]